MYMLKDSFDTQTLPHNLPNRSKITGHRSNTSSHAMTHIPPQETTGMARVSSTADSGVRIQHGHQSKHEALWGDLQKYIAQHQKHWLLARDVELARPLQTQYSAYEAEIMGEIRNTEDERVRTYNQRWRDMRGATGPTKLSWKLYKLKAKACAKWNHYQLHYGWKHAQLEAKKQALVEEYVRAQIRRRETLLREITSSADGLGMDDGDDGGYLRDGMLNYILMGYDGRFPISRTLDLGTEKRGLKELSSFTHPAPLTLWNTPAPRYLPLV